MARELHGPLDLNGNPITGLPLTPTVDTEAASKAYVDAAAGTGSDEVAITPTQPVAAGLELWIDTDAPPLTGGGGVSDHGGLTGLADDDHPQYVKKAGDTMSGPLTVADGGASPTADAAGAAILYVEGGVLKARYADAAGNGAIPRVIVGGTKPTTPAVGTMWVPAG